MAIPRLGERIAATFTHMSSELQDNALNNVPFAKKLKSKGNFKSVPGGRLVEEFLLYRGNGTYTRMSGWDTLNINPIEVFDRAEYTPYGVTCSVAINWTEMLENAGNEEKLIDLLDARLMGKEVEYRNNFERDCFGDGTLNKQFVGIDGLIDTTPATGIVGGINAANWDFWRHVYFSGVTDGGAAVSPTNIESYVDNVLRQVSREGDKCDLILADDNYFGFLQDAKRARGRLGFDDKSTDSFSLYHNGVQVIHCGGVNGAIDTNTMYLLNTDYIYLRSYTGKELEDLGERESVNQAGMIRLYGWYGCMTISNRFVQGRLGA